MVEALWPSVIWVVPSSKVMDSAQRDDDPFPDHVQLVCVDSPGSDLTLQPVYWNHNCISWVSTPECTPPEEKGAFIRLSDFSNMMMSSSRFRKVETMRCHKDELLLADVMLERIGAIRTC